MSAKSKRARRRERRAAQLSGYAALVRDGEVFIPNYCVDVAGCDCESTHREEHSGLDCKPVARVVPAGEPQRFDYTKPRRRGFDRCLQCDAVWERRDYRIDPLVIVRASQRAA